MRKWRQSPDVCSVYSTLPKVEPRNDTYGGTDHFHALYFGCLVAKLTVGIDSTRRSALVFLAGVKVIHCNSKLVETVGRPRVKGCVVGGFYLVRIVFVG